MILKKCCRCNLLSKESSLDFYKRTTISFKLPYTCKSCLRIQQAKIVPHTVKFPKKKKNITIVQIDLKKFDINKIPNKQKNQFAIKRNFYINFECFDEELIKKNELFEIMALYFQLEVLSVCYLIRKFKLSPDIAQKIIDLINSFPEK